MGEESWYMSDYTKRQIKTGNRRLLRLATYLRELFAASGCGCADTPRQAARYIERFVKRRGGA
jgi:hypothetical protein